MGKCKNCSKEVEYDNCLYCIECWNCRIGECSICTINNAFFSNDEIHIIKIHNNEYSLCDECFNKFLLDHNLIDYKSVLDSVVSFDKLNREKWKAKRRANDGHMLRSRGEILIDNHFYSKNIRHEYEKVVLDLEFGKEYKCDFYLPDYDLYIEFWGRNNDENYDKHRKEKEICYNKLNYKLLSILPENVDGDLETFFKKALSKYEKTSK